MTEQKPNIEEVKIFSKLASVILIAWAITFLLSLIIGTFYLGHVPVYGIDQDPNSLNSSFLAWIQLINLCSFFFSFFAFLSWPLLTFHSLINNANFTNVDRLLHLGALLSILVFFFFKYILTDQFLWYYD